MKRGLGQSCVSRLNLLFPSEHIGGTGIGVQHPGHVIKGYPVVLRHDGGDTVRGDCEFELAHVCVTGGVHHAAVACDSGEDQAMRPHQLEQKLQRSRKEA